MNAYHIQQLGKVLHFIENNLGEALTLESVAAAGNYSPYHFHRLFKAYTSETVLEFINRKRLEKVAGLLIRDRKATIAELAFRSGFSDNAALTKAFKKRYSVSPTAFRKQSTSQYDKIITSKNGQFFQGFEAYLCHIDSSKNWIKMNTTVIVKEVAPLQRVYVNQIGVDNLDAAFYKIIDWALAKGLTQPAGMEVIRLYHDSFKITAPDKVRMEIGVKVTKTVEPEPGIFYKVSKPGTCIVGNFEIELNDFEKAWSSLYIWMNENGYRPASEPAFEIIHNNYNEHPQKKCLVTLHIPVIAKD